MRQLFGTCLVLVSAAPSFAHDFWIEPSAFVPKIGEPVKVFLRVGEHFKGEPVERNPQRIDQFILAGPDGVKPVLGQEGADPAGLITLDEPGVYLLGYRSRRSSIELEAAKFEAYLKEEGLDHVIAERAKLGESPKPGREIYSRCAKALIRTTDAKGSGHDRRLDFRLELIPGTDPASVDREKPELTVLVMFEGKPLRAVSVFAMNRSEPQDRLTARTDDDGKVTLALTRPGVWMIKCIHMIRAPKDVDADWESLWATLTFESH